MPGAGRSGLLVRAAPGREPRGTSLRISHARLGVAALLVAAGAAHATTAITAGKARFELLTPSLVRMEYSPDGVFVNAPTAVVRRRAWPAVRVRSRRKDGWLILETRNLTLRYRPASGAFSASDLRVRWKDSRGKAHLWHPGMRDPDNLGGLTYSLDNISAANLPRNDRASPIDDIIPGIEVRLRPATPGLLSRAGFAFLDDSATPVWNRRHTRIEPRPGPPGEDGYLFVYGHDYRKALEEYAELCGPVPMIPRYALGPWITDFNFEYFPGSAQSRSRAFRRYGERHLESEIRRLGAAGIPLSGLVLDFGWHDYGWQGGYDWSPLIAHPGKLIAWLRARGMRLALNDHPGYANTRESILSYHDSHAAQVLKALGRAPPARPALDLDLAHSFRFAPDPHEVGVTQRWYAAGYDDHLWKPIRTDQPWGQQRRGGHSRIGWYRATIRLPAPLPHTLYLYLGAVADHYQLFVNGRRVPHSHVQWPRRLTYADIASQARPGRRNVIALRVAAGRRGGGILAGPVALRNLAPPHRIAFNLANAHQAEVFMRLLHGPLMRQGVDFWWVDGGGGAAGMPGLDPQLWTNRVFYDYERAESGRRAFILSRYGGWGSERYPGFFTGDAWSEWPVLAYEVAFTARGGNVLVPYISNDIGGFHGGRIPFALYARWIEFGAFSPILRMHSAHENPLEGNSRMPWVYGPRGVALMRRYFRLRARLIPYLYTYVWRAHERAMPLMRPLYIEWPRLPEAYRHDHEYLFGSQMLVAPVLDPSGVRSVYLPPGRWIDFFSGRRYRGGATFTARYAPERIPLFVREGAIIPEARPAAGPDTLELAIYGGGKGHFDLYQDDGLSFAFRRGAYAETPLEWSSTGNGAHTLIIGPTHGTFAGEARRRAYLIRIHAIGRPRKVMLEGKPLGAWTWKRAHKRLDIRVPAQDIRRKVTLSIQ